MNIREWDIFTEVPDELVEQYNVVHVKLLVFVVKGDVIPILRNLLRMLSTDTGLTRKYTWQKNLLTNVPQSLEDGFSGPS